MKAGPCVASCASPSKSTAREPSATSRSKPRASPNRASRPAWPSASPGLHFDAPGEKAHTHWTFVSGLYEKQDDEDDGKNGQAQKEESATDSNEQGVVIDEKSEGSLEPEEIEDVVHAGFGLFAHCYREGLGRHPRLAGAVRLRMVIGRDGVVDHLRDADSDIPDPELIDCVAEGFFALRFPKPRSGTVRLLYRIAFDNG